MKQNAARNYLRKWGSWVQNDEYQHPTIPPKYNIGYVVKNCTLELLAALEPWCDRIYVNERFEVIGRMWDYVELEQENTSFDLSKRVYTIEHNDPSLENDIVVEFDAHKFTNAEFAFLQRLPEIIEDSGEIGEFEFDIFRITINSMNEHQNELIQSKK